MAQLVQSWPQIPESHPHGVELGFVIERRLARQVKQHLGNAKPVLI
jgi:hypothetical protein